MKSSKAWLIFDALTIVGIIAPFLASNKQQLGNLKSTRNRWLAYIPGQELKFISDSIGSIDAFCINLNLI